MKFNNAWAKWLTKQQYRSHLHVVKSWKIISLAALSEIEAMKGTDKEREALPQCAYLHSQANIFISGPGTVLCRLRAMFKT